MFSPRTTAAELHHDVQATGISYDEYRYVIRFFSYMLGSFFLRLRRLHQARPGGEPRTKYS